MQMLDFYLMVENDPRLQGLGCDADHVYVHCGNMITKLSVDCILRESREVLEPILVGELEPEKLKHMSRIVGYFSRIENWNASKIAELKDRHNGDYRIG